MLLSDDMPPKIAKIVKLAKYGFFDVGRGVFWQAHPTTIRMLLAISSMGWAINIIADPAVLTRWPYQHMLMVMPNWMWVIAFVAHFIGTFWRIYDSVPRVRWALAVNSLGCFLWIALTLCIHLRAARFIPGSCLEVVTCAFAAWALIRTGVGKDVGTP